MAYIGIDLGTTFSAVAAIDETGRPKILHNKEGGNITPSCIIISENNTVDVGEEARKGYGLDPNVAARFKRQMGTNETYEIMDRTFTPTELSGFVLKKLFSDAQNAIGEVKEAVVTIPANFSHEARDATMQAAKLAGLNVKYIINEPTAAALYYAYKNDEELAGIYAVYDMGGGTFDISIIHINGHNIDVLATNGVSRLGGDDFDAAIQKIVQEKYKLATGEDLEPEDYTKNDAENEKKSLSKKEKTSARANRKYIDISRGEFEESISSLIAQSEMLCESSIHEADISLTDIKGVLLVGGSTRMPIVLDSVKRVFGIEPTSSINVDEVVALGAALYAAYKSDKKHLSPLQKNAINKIKVGETTSKCFGIISLSDDNAAGQARLTNSVLIRKGESIPCSVTESFFTIHADQQEVNCQVTEASSPETDPKFVKVIWSGELKLPTNRPEGQEIKVTFSYDDNQIMKCSFVDAETKEETGADLSFSTNNEEKSDGIDKFLVE